MPGAGCAQYTCSRAAHVAQLAGLVAHVDAGKLVIEVAQRLPLADLPGHARAAGQFARIAELAARAEGGDLAERLRADQARSAPRLPPETWPARPS